MRKLFTFSAGVLLMAGLFLPRQTNAQVPQKMSYQAVIRNSSNALVTSAAIGMRISILQGSSTGTPVYIETYNPSLFTNSNGLVTAEIGGGVPLSGSFDSIDWANGPYFIKTETDPSGGTNYTITGTSQLLTVPYALYAKTAGNSISLIPPTVTASEATNIDTTSAILNGTVNGNGFKTDVTFEWDTVMGYGNSINAIQDPVVGSDNVAVSANLTGLQPNRKIYYRIKVSNAINSAISDSISFTTKQLKGQIAFNPVLTYGSVTDIEGNNYKTIQIGTQVWIAENLKTTKYNDGTPIPNVTGFTEWSALTAGAYCWYNNDSLANKSTNGALYNWYTVNTGKLCPIGWHVPSQEEWIILMEYVGGKDIAGVKLKETGNTHWQGTYNGESPITAATNEYGFTALPAGTRNLFGDPDFNDWSWINMSTLWWSSSKSANNTAIYWGVFYNSNAIDYQSLLFEQSGFCIRCLKD